MRVSAFVAHKVHGATIAVERGRVELAPIASLVGVFAEGAVEEADLVVRVARVDGDAQTRRPVFFHGEMQAFEADGRWLFVHRDARASLDAARGELCCERGGGALASPGAWAGLLAAALSMFFRLRGLFELHAAGAAGPMGLVLLVGDSGSGKSTTTLALLEAGLGYLGDDRLLLGREGGALVVRSFPREFHVGEAAARAFLGVTAALEGEADAFGKRALSPVALFGGRHVERCEGPVSLLLPRIVDASSTEITPVGQAEVMGELLCASALAAVDFVPFGAENVALLGALAGLARGYRLQLGRDLLEAPVDVARSLLERLAG